jgi:hypothetical protein
MKTNLVIISSILLLLLIILPFLHGYIYCNVKEKFSFDEPFPIPNTNLTCSCPKGHDTSTNNDTKECLYCNDAKQIITEGTDGHKACYDLDYYEPSNIRQPIDSCNNSKKIMEIKDRTNIDDGLYCYNCPDKFPNAEINSFANWIGDSIICKSATDEYDTTRLAEDIVKIDKCPNQEFIDNRYCVDKCKDGYNLVIKNGQPKCAGYINPIEPERTPMLCFADDQ